MDNSLCFFVFRGYWGFLLDGNSKSQDLLELSWGGGRRGAETDDFESHREFLDVDDFKTSRDGCLKPPVSKWENNVFLCKNICTILYM